jgi:CDP-diacylglycerol--serine O-phosphatidyltransferase
MNILRAIRVPDLFSIMNLAFGFGAVLAASRGSIEFSVLLVILSAVFDGIDGFLARKVKASDLGFSLDSLADLVSFGVAPASIAAAAFGFSGYALTVSLIFLTCGTLRLARFNVSNRADEHFEGFPITASGIATVASVLLDRPWLTLALMLILSILMVSSIPYPKIRDSRLVAAFALVLLAAAVLFQFTGNTAPSGTLILAAMLVYMASPVVISCLPTGK